MNQHSVWKTKRERLKRMLTPRSAVFVGGASSVPAIEYCRARGYEGRIYVINPKRKELAGIPCVTSAALLPEVPDVAYVAVPRDSVIGVIKELSDLGVAGAICNSSGFSEIHGGDISQTALVDAAGSMSVIGPNCPGVANFADRSVFMMDHFGDHDAAGCVAVISNGGAYLSDIGCADRSLPLAYSVGLGNQAMVTAADILDVVIDDGRVRAVNLYLEEIANASALAAAGLRAARKGIPIVVIKGGRTSAGQRATQSHTASLAGDEVVSSALFRRLGFVEVHTPTEAIETLKMLIYTLPVRGRRTAFATSSGSYAVLGGDIAEANGLDLQPPTIEASKELEKHLPPLVHPANPLDISAAHSNDTDFNLNLSIYRAYLADDRDMALQVMCYPPEGGWAPSGWDVTTKAFAQAARERGIPAAFVNTLPNSLTRSVRERMIADGLVPLMGLEDGIRAVANAMRLVELAGELAKRADSEILLPNNPTIIGTGTGIDETAAKAKLKAAGIRVPNGAVVEPNQTKGLQELKFPVAVKALSPSLAHKSELGAVILGIKTRNAVKQSVISMVQALGVKAPDLSVRNFLVEEMVTDGIGELLIGVRQVDRVGLALTIGMGGTESELLRDTATILLPASRTTIAEALRGLRLFPLLNGWRGKPGGDVEGTLDVIERFASFALSNSHSLIEAEINPLIVRPAGKGAVAVDAVMRFVDS